MSKTLKLSIIGIMVLGLLPVLAFNNSKSNYQQLTYCVNYFYNESLDNNSKECYNGQISNYENSYFIDKPKDGFVFVKYEKKNGVIDVYYKTGTSSIVASPNTGF